MDTALTEMPFRITAIPDSEPNTYRLYVADIPVGKIISTRPLEEIQLDYQLPAVLLRYHNTILPDEHLRVRDADFEIVSAISFLTAGMVP